MDIKNEAFAKSMEENNIDDNMKLLRNLRTQNIININMVRVFISLWLVVSILVAIPYFRESGYSEVEKRELEKFPKFSWDALASGEYFDGVNLWFADTFPMRDDFVSFNANITNYFGINDIQVHGDELKSDDIPDIEVLDEPINQEEYLPPVVDQTEPPKPIVENFGAIFVLDDTAYEQYHFNEVAANTYCAAVDRAASILAGKAKVYNMVIPTSIDITMPQEERKNVNSTDQKKAIDYIYGRMSANVNKIDVYSTLMAHKNEYIYFRTDHHWTSLGAYYAYSDLMSAVGKTAAPLSAFNEYKYDGFLGSFFTTTQSPGLKENADYVLAYEPKQLQKIHYFTKDGESNLSIVSNGEKLSAANKYLTFICGDKPYGIMTNPEITDGSSCLVIKESYGNAMVSYLTQNYQNVYVVDYRYISQVFPGTLRQFVDERGIQDVFFVNNISATRSKDHVDAINVFVGQ
ncbi:MAG: hypothetical protein IKT42_06915 [Clostridia bacterium]|nr:hypothetical protein [Clostridia bacterium]